MNSLRALNQGVLWATRSVPVRSVRPEKYIVKGRSQGFLTQIARVDLNHHRSFSSSSHCFHAHGHLQGIDSNGRNATRPSAPSSPHASTRQSQQSAKTRKLLKRQNLDPPSHALNCVAASRADGYDIKRAHEELTKRGMFPEIDEVAELVHLRLGGSDVLVLSGGTVVAWGMTEDELRAALLPALEDAEVTPFSATESEDMDYVEEQTAEDADVASGMIGDVIYINGATEAERLRDKIAFSYGLARHIKLAALEIRVEALIQQVRGVSRRMAAGRDPGLTEKDARIITGRLLQLRGHLNLYSNITETPDLFWSEPELERLHELVIKKLDVLPRAETLNKKIDYVSDMAAILRAHLSERLSIKLEWLIIILIAFEVVFELWRTFRPAPKEEHN